VWIQNELSKSGQSPRWDNDKFTIIFSKNNFSIRKIILEFEKNLGPPNEICDKNIRGE
jgi:hypothetical protein